jgi:hypothetical protein
VEIQAGGDGAGETRGAVMIHDDDGQYYDERDAGARMQNGQAVLIWTGLGHALATAEGHASVRDYATMTTDFAALEAAMRREAMVGDFLPMVGDDGTLGGGSGEE